MKFKYLSLEKNTNDIKRLLFYILLLTFISASPIYAATYNYYFSNAGSGTTCSQGSPCANLSDAQNKIDAAGSSDTVNLYFNKGDTWTFDTRSGPTVNYGLLIDDSDPIVHIDAYGSGAKPKFDGLLTDFSTAADADETGRTGPLDWSNVFQIERDNCSIKNIHIDHVYGRAIAFSNIADNITIESCDITNFGTVAVSADLNYGTIGTTVTKCLIHTGQQLMRYGISAYNSWGGAIEFSPVPSDRRGGYNNTASYNVIYNIYGEGIHSLFGTAEYNIIGDTWSVALYVNPFGNNAHDTVVRYNIITGSSSGTYKGGHDGIAIVDEGDGYSGCPSSGGGNNSGATIEVYGNVVVNRNYGFHFSNCDTTGNPWGEIRIYNNTIIDSYAWNFAIDEFQKVATGKGYYYNNRSILYDRTGDKHVTESGSGTFSNYWTVNNNAFWTAGGSTYVDSDWRMNYVTTDPKLAGEEQGSPINWDGLIVGDPRGLVTFANVTSNVDDGGIGAGAIIYSESQTALKAPAGLTIRIE